MLLIENILAKPILEEISREKLPEGVLCRVSYPICDIGQKNANNRVYEDAVFDKVLAEKELKEKLENRALFGHAEHPEQTQSNLEKTSHVIFEMWKDNAQVWQKFDVLDTPTGRIVDTLLRAGCRVGCSTRAEGDLEEAEDDEGNTYQNVISDSYNYVTTDFTADPSTFGSIPHDIQRNVVAEVKRELKNEKLNGTERQFAQLIFEAMKCQDSKCVIEGAKKMAKKVKEEKKLYITEGVWALPNTLERAKRLAKLMSSPVSSYDAVHSLFSLLGDDKLWDKFRYKADGTSPRTNDDTRPMLKKRIKQYLADYEKDPGDFKGRKLNDEAKEILQKLVNESTMLDLVNNELIKVNQEVNYKDQRWKVSKIEEGAVSLLVGAENPTTVNVEGDAAISISPEGLITILPTEALVALGQKEPKEEELISEEPPFVEPGTADAIIVGDEDIEGRGQRDGMGPPDGEIGIRKMRGEECPFERKVIGPEDTIEVGNTIEIRDLADTETVVEASKVTEVGTMIGDVDTEFHKVKTESGGDKWYEAEGYALVRIGEKIIPEAKGIPATGTEHIQDGWWYDKEGLRWRVTDSTTDLLTIKSRTGKTDKILLKDFIKKYSRRELPEAKKPGKNGKKESIEVGATVKIEEGEHKDKEAEVIKIKETGITVALDDGTMVAIEDPTAVSIVVTKSAPAEEIEPVVPPEEEIEDTEVTEPLPVEKDIPESKIVEGVDDELAAGNLLQDKDKKDWVVKSVGDGGLTVNQPGEPGTEKFIDWEDVDSLGFTKVSESKVEETEAGEAKYEEILQDVIKRIKDGQDAAKLLSDVTKSWGIPRSQSIELYNKANSEKYLDTGDTWFESKVQEATSVEKNGEWFVESPSGAILGGPYKSKIEADKRKKDVEFYAASRESKVDEDKENGWSSLSDESLVTAYNVFMKLADAGRPFDSKDVAAVFAQIKKRGLEDKVLGDKNSESKVDETADIKAMYKAADLPAPDGKGIHTKAFHELVINVAKGYVKSGDTSKEALDKAYPTAMKQLGKEKAVKKPHQKESKVDEGFKTDLKNKDKAAVSKNIGAVTDKLLAGETLSRAEKHYWKDYGDAVNATEAKVKESVSTTVKEIKNLRVQEASTRAERDKAIELLEELTDDTQQLEEKVRKEKSFEAKILVNKIGKAIEVKELEVDALRFKLEEKAKLAANLKEQLEEKSKLAVKVKEQLDGIKTNLSNDIKNLNESVSAAENKHQKDLSEAEKKYQKELSKAVKLSEKEIEEAKEETKEKVKNEVTKEFVKSYVDVKLSETDLKVDENSQALLEDCKSLEEVDNFLDEIVDASRRSTLHSNTLTSIHVVKHEVIDPEQKEAERLVGDVFESFGM